MEDLMAMAFLHPQEMQARLVGSEIAIMPIYFRIRGFEIARCTGRAAQHYSLRPTRDSTKPTASRDLLTANEAFLLRGIVTLQLADLLFFGRGLSGSAQAERFHIAFCDARPGLRMVSGKRV